MSALIKIEACGDYIVASFEENDAVVVAFEHDDAISFADKLRTVAVRAKAQKLARETLSRSRGSRE